ncbi:tubulin-like doman-containing protein [Nakamurella alba]|nr:tubulin-like doman-containing protein [Nakamurella alba]
MFVVGLGGSGGKTLQFLMDQLRNELHAKGWTDDTLPASWKFVHIDVPQVPDGVGEGLPDTVPQQGGTYIPVVTTPNATYTQLDAGVVGGIPSMEELVGWRPDPPENVGVTIQLGAGQYRAVGRMLTLSKTGQIFERLTALAGEINSPAAHRDAARLRSLLSLPPQPISESMVIVVSSLAGGTGASMTLDVCNLLRNIQGIPGDRSIAFLYAPDVFNKLDEGARQGVNANALGTISEMLSAQLNKTQPWTDAQWQIYRASGAPFRPGRGPFAVFAVGASAGTGITPFGNGANDIYRSMARTLVPLLMSEKMQNDLEGYTTTNWETMAGLVDKSPLAWKPSGPQAVQLLGGIGSGRISLGRDRYEEYVAQRLARMSVERLLRGHQTDAVRQGTQTDREAIDLIRFGEYMNFLRAAGLPAIDPSRTDIEALSGWVSTLIPVAESQRLADQATGSIVPMLFGQVSALTGSQIAARLDQNIESLALSLKNQADEAARGAAGRWVTSFQSHVETGALRVAGRRGLPVLRAVLQQFRDEITTWSGTLQEWSTRLPSPTGLSQQATASFAQEKAQLGPQHPQLQDALRQINGGLMTIAVQSGAAMLADLLREATTRVLEPLLAAVGRAENDLTVLEENVAGSKAVASVRTEQVTHWPEGDAVAARWSTATNEVLLEPAAEYPARFADHMRKTFTLTEMVSRQKPTDVESARMAAEEVITFFDAGPMLPQVQAADRMPAFDPSTGSPTRIGRQATWWPQKLGIQQQPADAVYSPQFTPAELLAGAREWVRRPGSELREFVRQGIRAAWLRPDAQRSGPEQDRFEQEFTAKFFEALDKSAPLASVNEAMVQAIHDKPNVQITYQFSEMPFAGMRGIVDRIVQRLRATNTIDDLRAVEAFTNAASSTVDQPSIDIQGMFAQPYSPLVFNSLMDPVRGQWVSASASQRAAFWDKRRSRVLRDFLPVSHDWIRTFVTGWLVGRVTGEIVVPGQLDSSQVVRVFSPAPLGQGGTWLEFGPRLLGVAGINIDATGWSIPAKVLESLALAVALCNGDPTLKALAPYVAVRKLGERYPQEGADGQYLPVNPALQAWITDGRSRSGIAPQVLDELKASGDPLADARARRDQVLEWIAGVGQDFEPYRNLPVRRSNWKDVEPWWEIVDFLLAGAAELDGVARDEKFLTLVSRAAPETPVWSAGEDEPPPAKPRSRA